MDDREVSQQRSRRDCGFPHTSFEEIPGRHRFRKDHDVGWLLQNRDLRKDVPDPPQILGIIRLPRRDLGERYQGCRHLKRPSLGYRSRSVRRIQPKRLDRTIGPGRKGLTRPGKNIVSDRQSSASLIPSVF
jgi:hypothetical protein